MFIQLGRSHGREPLEMAKYVFTNYKTEGKSETRLLFISQFLKLMMSVPLLVSLFFFVLAPPLSFLCSDLIGVLVI
jgi:hyaluronan synthase